MAGRVICCNQMGDKHLLVEYIESLEALVRDAYREGVINGVKKGYGVPFEESETSQKLLLNKKEVV